jgi:hypothetical protein
MFSALAFQILHNNFHLNHHPIVIRADCSELLVLCMQRAATLPLTGRITTHRSD